MNIFFILIFLIIQYIYMVLVYNKNPDCLIKQRFDYTINNVKQSLTVNQTVHFSKKYVLMISGSYKLNYDVYVKKIIYDLREQNKELFNKFDFIVFEKINKCSITIYEDIIEYVNELNKTGIEELIIIGFSAGGVISSHVLAGLKHIICRKKLITYDAPWQVMDNVKSFQYNTLYRLDIIFFEIVYKIYKNHYNYEEIKENLKRENYFNGSDELIDMIKRIHNFNDEDFYKLTGFNLDQEKDTKIINIYSDKDPFVNRFTHLSFLRKNRQQIDLLNITNINKDRIGHCTDMAYDSEYLKDIIWAMEL